MTWLASRETMMRVGAVCSLVAFGIVLLATLADRRGDFQFFRPYSRGFDQVGPATWMVAGCLVVIWGVCIGLPWIIESARKAGKD